MMSVSNNFWRSALKKIGLMTVGEHERFVAECVSFCDEYLCETDDVLVSDEKWDGDVVSFDTTVIIAGNRVLVKDCTLRSVAVAPWVGDCSIIGNRFAGNAES